MTDQDYMLRCLELARNGCYYVAPNPMVGAVLVDPEADAVIAEGWHKQYGGPHAEVECFRAADRYMESWPEQERVAHYRKLTLYVSLEPCSHYGKTPPCADLIIHKGVRRVVIGCLDPNLKVAGHGIEKLCQAGIEVLVGVEQQACRELNKRFVCLHENSRPYVILKWAQTADGFVDYLRTGGEPLTISTPFTKQLVHKMRAENMAIMVGTRTALLDNPSLLTTRWQGRNPIRILLDRHYRVPRDARIFSPEAPTIVYSDNTDWIFILDDLAGRNIHSVMVEGGPTVLNSILQSGIWDEMHVEVSPAKIGSGIPAPTVGLDEPDKRDSIYCEMIDGHSMYTIYRKG